MAEETPTIAEEIAETLETIEEDVVPESLPVEKAEEVPTDEKPKKSLNRL